MSFPLPALGTPAREACGDIAHLAVVLNPSNLDRLPTFGEALRMTRANFPAGAKAVNVICIRADDERWLISVGPRGGWRLVWNFGCGR